MDLQTNSYPSCPLPSHGLEPLSRICLDQKCRQRAPVCCICEYEAHKDHHTVHIKQIVKQISDSNHNIAPLDAQEKVSALRKQYYSLLNRFKKEILESICELEVKGEIYFNMCEEAILGFYSVSQPLSPEIQSDAKLYSRYFYKLLTLVSSEDHKDFCLGEKMNNLVQKYQLQHKKMVQQIGKLQTDLKKSVQQVNKWLEDPVNPVYKLSSIKWSQTLKGSKIKINELVAEQSGIESSGQRFALVEQSLPLNTKSQWGIKIKKFVGWVGIGICLKNCIETAKYHFNYTNIGHGSYLISSNGYSWSHSVKDYNSAFKSFQFTTNDTVYVEYDPIALKLRFRKNHGSEKFEFDIVHPPAGDTFHPCVNLCSSGDSVQLIYPGATLS